MNQRCKDSGMLQSDSEDGVRVRERVGTGEGGEAKSGVYQKIQPFFFLFILGAKKKT